jgi:hypothetical protein
MDRMPKAIEYIEPVSYKRPILIRRIYKPTQSVVKQEVWRQKQIDTFYNHGRPLFGAYKSDYRDTEFNYKYY